MLLAAVEATSREVVHVGMVERTTASSRGGRAMAVGEEG